MNRRDILNQVIDGLKMPAGMSQSEAWTELQSKLSQQDSVPVRNIRPSLLRRTVPFIAAASVALAVFFLFPSETTQTAEFSTSGQTSELIVLSDGSEVKLGPNSDLIFTTDDNERLVVLKGEGFFNVTKGIPFKVKTTSGDVSVLGTSFNVNARNNTLDVKCFTGEVLVELESEATLLTKGLGVNSISSKMYSHASVEKSNKQGGLFFDQQPLSFVIEDLKHYKGFIISNNSGIDPIISLDLSNESLSEVSQILTKITLLKAKTVGDGEVVLYK